MGHILLWIELLAVNLLFIAFLLACLGRIKRRWLRVTLGLPIGLFILGPAITLLVALGQLKFNRGVENLHFYPMATLTACTVLGGLLLWFVGLRRTGDEVAPTRAARWPRLKLLVGWGAAAAVQVATLLTLDSYMLQEMAELRSEAAQLMQSVSQPPLPDEENAAVPLRQAFELMGTEAQQSEWPAIWEEALNAADRESDDLLSTVGEADEPPPEPFDFADPQLATFLEQQAEALDLLREAAQRPGCYLGHDYTDQGVLFIIPEIPDFRQAARLLGVDARHQAAIGDFSRALEDINAMFRLAQHAGNEPSLVWGLVSIALQQASIEAFKDVMAEGPVPEQALAKLDTSNLPEYREVLHRAFIGEEAYGLAILGGNDLGDGGVGSGPNSFLEVGPIYRVMLLSKDAELYRRDMQAMQGFAELPFKDGVPAARVYGNNLTGSYFTLLMVPAMAITLEASQRGDAYGAELELALALYRYQARNRRMPESLEELVPEFLSELPVDPHDGQLVRVKRGENSWTVYTLGADGDDDGGTPIDYDNHREGDYTLEVAVWDFEEAP